MLGLVLLLTGSLLMLLGSVMFLIKAFRVSVAWGVGVLLLAPVGIVFLVKNWRESRTSFLMQLGGLALFVAGVFLGHPVPGQQ